MFKISFITITLNNKNGLNRTIESYISFNKKYPNSELVVIDGLSTDGTNEIFDQYRSIIDILICEKDNGIYDAMNKGLKLFTGDFVCFMNAGDEIIVDGMVELVSILRIGHCFAGKVVWDNKIKSFDYINYLPWLLRLPIHQAMVIHKDLAYTFDLSFPIASDIDQKLSIAKTAKLVNCNVVVALCESGGISQNIPNFSKLRIRAKEIYNISFKHFGLFIGALNYIKFLLWHSLKLINRRHSI